MPTVIGFDSLPAGTVVTTQLQGQGVVFSGGTTRDDPTAPSARNVLQATNLDVSTPEFPIASVSGTFTDPHHARIGVFIVLAQGSLFGGSATLFAYDVNDNEIARVLIEVPTGEHSLYNELISPASNIASFKVSGGGNSSFEGVDNVTFDDLTVPQVPDFLFQYFGTGVTLVPGGVKQYVPISVIRLNGSSGEIDLDATGLPAAVILSKITPNPFIAPGGTPFFLDLQALSGAFPIQNGTIVVTGTPHLASAGTMARSVSIPVSVIDSYDVEIVGIEVTQGIQGYDLAGHNWDIGGGFVDISYHDWSPVLVDLAQGGKTIVRVFANVVTEPRNSNVPPMDCLLWGTSDQPGGLPGSPLSPENSFVPQPGLDYVEDRVRADPNAGYYFTLPPSWTVGILELDATLSPTPSLFPPENEPVTHNVLFNLSDIRFTPTRNVSISPFGLRITNPADGSLLYGSHAVLEDARNLLPIGENQFLLSDYVGDIDITDIYNQPEDDISRGIDVAARLRDRADDWNYTDSGEMIVGIFSALAAPRIRGLESRSCTGAFWDCDGLSVAIFQDAGRPLSAVAHELGHLFGRKHASSACGASNAQDWPPDEQGFIQGVGLDRRSGRVLFPDRTGGSLGGPVYDFMGYCGQNGNYDPDKWISVRGWNDTLRNALAIGAPGSVAPLASANSKSLSLQTSSDQQLIIHAVHNHTGEFKFTKVAPGHATLEEIDEHSHYRLTVRDENGTIVRETGMRVSVMHSDDAANLNFCNAKMTVRDVRILESVEIAHKGKVVARRTRSKESPFIKDVIVVPDFETDCIRRTLIMWKALHPEKKSLMAKVDFSADGGNTWRPIYFGPNTNQAALAGSFFSASSDAVVRVRVSDGFNESHADSRCFTAAGRPPMVRIKSPSDCARIRRGAAIYLSGEAFDDKHQPIVGKQLVWSIGKRRVATGATASVPMLKPGIFNVKLTATDAQERSTTMKTRLSVTS